MHGIENRLIDLAALCEDGSKYFVYIYILWDFIYKCDILLFYCGFNTLTHDPGYCARKSGTTFISKGGRVLQDVCWSVSQINGVSFICILQPAEATAIMSLIGRVIMNTNAM